MEVHGSPGLENFEHYFTSVWDESNCVVVWAFLGIAFLWGWNENWFFQSCDHCWVFQICWHIQCSTFTASSFRIWYSSTGIPSSPLALFSILLSLFYHFYSYFGVLLYMSKEIITFKNKTSIYIFFPNQKKTFQSQCSRFQIKMTD